MTAAPGPHVLAETGNVTAQSVSALTSCPRWRLIPTTLKPWKQVQNPMSDVPVIPLVDIGRTDVAVLDRGPAEWLPQAAGRDPETGR
jgi:hypothetical protein